MNEVNTIMLAHHEAPDQPFWLLLVAATLLAAVAAILINRSDKRG